MAIMLSAMVLAGCEVIGEGERLVPVSQPADTTDRTHVLIEFTGFRCVNCPNAAAAAEALHQTYGERLIIVAMHPASNPFTQGAAQYDYTCPEADDYYRLLGGSATTPFPTGNINLATRDGSSLHDYPEWPAWLVQQMSEPTRVHLSVTAGSEADRITVTTTAYADVAASCRIVTWLVEDSIQSAQAMPDGSVNTQYYHRHVLSGAAGSSEGEPLTLQRTPVTHTTTLTLREDCDPKRCSFVVAVMDNENKIINARQTTIQ